MDTMEKELIYKDSILNMPVTFQVTGKHDAEVVTQTLKAVCDYVKALPAVEPEKKPVTRRKKTT